MYRGADRRPSGQNRLFFLAKVACFFWNLAYLPASLHSPDLSPSEIAIQAGDDGLWGVNFLGGQVD